MSFIEDVKSGWTDRSPKTTQSDGRLTIYKITRGIELGQRLRNTWGKWLCTQGIHEEKDLWRPEHFATDIRPWRCWRCRSIVVWSTAEKKAKIIQPTYEAIQNWVEQNEVAELVAKEAWQKWYDRPQCGYQYDGFGPCTRDVNHSGDHGHEVEPGLIFAPYPDEHILGGGSSTRGAVR